MAHKHLHELLKEDQEPFHLQSYISERRSLLKPPNSLSKISKRNPNNICKHACFLQFHHESPDFWNSQFQEFPLQKSPIRTQNSTLLLPVPALLLEAAMRIEKKQGSHKNRANMKNLGFGILGSVLKKLKDRKNNKRGELGHSRSSQNGKMQEKASDETSFSCNCNNHNSSLSTTLNSFSLQTPSSSGHRSPDLSSANPKSAEGSNNEVGDEHSEQCSPVSVLDTPFEDDHVVGHEDDNEDEFEDDSYVDNDDLECSFAFVQEAKEQLLDKLRRFEELAGLDPVELEKRMMEDEDSGKEDNDDEAVPLGGDYDLDTLMMIEALSRSSSKHSRKLVSDLMEEENDEKYGGFKSKEVMVKRVSRRLSSWKELEPNKIDSMVKLDFEREFDGRKNNNVEESDEIVKEIEVALFLVLMEELTDEITSM